MKFSLRTLLVFNLEMTVSSNTLDLITIHYYAFTESSEVRNLQANSSDNSSLFISWDSPAASNGVILSYSILIIDVSDGNTVLEENTTADTNMIFQSNLSMYLKQLIFS